MNVGLVLAGNTALIEDRADRALGFASRAADTNFRVDEELHVGKTLGTLGRWHRPKLVERREAVDALAGTDIDTGCIAGTDALTGDYVCHGVSVSNADAML